MTTTHQTTRAGKVMLAASAVALVVSVLSGIRRELDADCQSRVNEHLILSQNARAAAAEQDRRAIDSLVNAVAEAQSPATIRQALDSYRKARTETDLDRARNPLPAPPSETCG